MCKTKIIVEELPTEVEQESVTLTLSQSRDLQDLDQYLKESNSQDLQQEN